MSLVKVVQDFFRYLEQGEWEVIKAMLAEDFALIGGTAQPLDKRAFLSASRARWAAFPDLQFNFRCIVEQGTQVTGTIHMTGTHTGTLIPPLAGKFIVIKPTGKKIALSEQRCICTLRDKVIVSIETDHNPDSGWPGLLKQLGFQEL